MNFYKHYIGDFQRDTGHLSLTERGAYLALIHHYYATEKALPNNIDALCRVAGAVTKQERAAFHSGAPICLIARGRINLRWLQFSNLGMVVEGRA